MTIPPVSRRGFLGATTASAFAGSARANESDTSTIRVGVMGLSRGLSLAKNFAACPGVEIHYVCDVDERRAAAAATAINKLSKVKAKPVGDFRTILDDKQIDVFVCAAPNHWHAPASIMACKAGKHVYVEKPCSHNAWEGELLVQAARKHKRCVQMGNQRRSAVKIIEGIKLIHDGGIGNVHYSRSWYANLRGPIGDGKPAKVPDHVDYELWQGPAPRLPFVNNRLHYNWHWVWHYGNGELGNNGIHSIDLSRWGLNVDYPTRVTSSGGRHWFNDSQETPDTHLVSFEFEGGKQIMWEGLSCNRHGIDGESFGVSFHGDKGSLTMDSWGYTLLDKKDKELKKVSGKAADLVHIANFIQAVRKDDPSLLASEIEEGHKSTLLCHLGNIAHRTGHSLTCDQANGHIKDDPAAADMWKRDYESGWTPNV
ncbi:MAG: Gfo/Idh/MocA family protein [Planctomycetaceae bacterium]